MADDDNPGTPTREVNSISGIRSRTLLAVIMAFALVGLVAVQPASAGSPTLTTDAATGVGDYGATLNGNLTALGTGTAYVWVGFKYGKTSDLSGSDTKNVTSAPAAAGNLTATGLFSYGVSGLVLKTHYYFLAWAWENGSLAFVQGSILEFNTTNTLGDSLTAMTVLVTNLFVALIPLVVIVAIFGVLLGKLTGMFGKLKLGK